MKVFAVISVALSLAGITSAAPLTPRATKSAADIILEIAPESATCDGSAACRTNAEVGPLMAKAAAQYGVNTPAPIAAVLALTAFETGGYRYTTKNLVNPGQGTVNQQMYKYNYQYAQSIPALKAPLEALGNPQDTQDPALQNKVRDLLTTDEYNFGSGFWFLTTQCGGTGAVDALNKNPDQGFRAYMQCVGIPSVTEDRLAYWIRAKKAFGL